MTGADAVFLDTNVLVAATVEAHPSHQVAAALLARVAGRVAAPVRRRLRPGLLAGHGPPRPVKAMFRSSLFC